MGHPRTRAVITQNRLVHYRKAVSEKVNRAYTPFTTYRAGDPRSLANRGELQDRS